MRYYIFLFPVLSLFFSISCTKKSAPPAIGHVYTGRIINSICGQTTVQFIDGSSFGQGGWVEGPFTYNNVFKIANPCNWNPENSKVTDTIRFYFVETSVQNCTLCLALGHTPDTAYNIRYVK